MATAAEFFTVASLMQVGGATVGVTILATVFGQLFKSDTPWIPFLLSIIVSIILAGAADVLPNPTRYSIGSRAFFGDLLTWLIVLLNACLLFCGAVGANAVVWAGRARPEIPRGERQSFKDRKRPKLFSPWL